MLKVRIIAVQRLYLNDHQMQQHRVRKPQGPAGGGIK